VPRLAVATLLDGTFAEWKAAHTSVGVNDGVRTFMTEGALRALCAQMGTCSKVTIVVETVHEHYPDVLQFVRSLKAIGAGTARPGHRPAPLRRVLRAFPQGIHASYRVAYVLAENTSLLGR
jgi:malonyl-CoA O-methyltransferase